MSEEEGWYLRVRKGALEKGFSSQTRGWLKREQCPATAGWRASSLVAIGRTDFAQLDRQAAGVNGLRKFEGALVFELPPKYSPCA